MLAIYALPCKDSPAGDSRPPTSVTSRARARRFSGAKCANFQPAFSAASAVGMPSSAPSSKRDWRWRWHRPSGSVAATSAPQCADHVGPLWAQQRQSRARAGSQWAWLAKPPLQPPRPGSSLGPAAIWSTSRKVRPEASLSRGKRMTRAVVDFGTRLLAALAALGALIGLTTLLALAVL